MRVSSPISQVDVIPTLLDLLGQPLADHLQGKSLRSWFDPQAEARPPEDVFIEWNGHNNGFGDVSGVVSIPQAMRALASEEDIIRATTDPVRTVITPDEWKLNYSPAGEHELYHLSQDPNEIHNLAAHPDPTNPDQSAHRKNTALASSNQRHGFAVKKRAYLITP